MTIAARIWKFRRLSWLLAVAFSLLGVISWITMPKEEDPKLKERFGVITIPFPGASPSEVQRKIVAPLTEELSEIEEIKKINSEARYQFAVLRIELGDSLSQSAAIDAAWNDIREAIRIAKQDWPDIVDGEELNRSVLDQHAMIYALTGENKTLLDLLAQAEDLKDHLMGITGVSRVDIIGDPGRQISIALDSKKLEDKGLRLASIVQKLAGSNVAAGSGSLEISGKNVGITANDTFSDLKELENFPIYSNNGTVNYLKELGRVSLTPKLPAEESVFWQGKPALMIGIVPEGNIDLIAVGDRVNKLMDGLVLTEGIDLDMVTFQPNYVEQRLLELAQSLLIGMLVIAGILLLFMGVRVGLLVALTIPSVTLISLTLYSYTGGVMQQISIAAFVLALGLLVDNFIVIVEGVQTRLDHGAQRSEAAILTIREFITPLAAATGTTVATFIPLLGSVGSTADFTRSIPQVTTLTLCLSYIFAILVTSSLSAYILKPNGKDQKKTVFESLGEKIAWFPSLYPKSTITLCVLALMAVLPLVPQLKMQFFPLADRNQLVVNLQLPEGSHLTSTEAAATELASAIESISYVESVGVFVGRSVPRFFYNLNQSLKSPHMAQMIVTFDDFKNGARLRQSIESLAQKIVPEASVVAKNLGQGPPVDADIAIKVFGQDREALWQAAERIQWSLRDQNLAVDIRSDIGLGQPTLNYVIADENAQRFGLARSQLTQMLVYYARGLPISDFYAETDTYDIVLMAQETLSGEPVSILDSYVAPSMTDSLYFRDLVRPDLDFHPASLKYENGRQLIHVYAELPDGVGFNQVLGPLVEGLAAEPLPTGLSYSIGGSAEESETANRAIAKVVPLGILLLLVSMMAQFNSFRRILIINAVVPFICIGVILGLWLTGQPFSFFSLLGALALIGIVVNNAILLVDYADTKVKEGITVDVAVKLAVSRRLRPIFLTTLTTIAGLLPLALGKATLWPPFAYAIIFGLIASACITLFLVASLYMLFFAKKAENLSAEEVTDLGAKQKLKGVAEATVILLAVALVSLSSQDGLSNTVQDGNDVSLPLSKVLELVAGSKPVQSSRTQRDQALISQDLQNAAAFYPKVGAKVERIFRDRETYSEGPFGIKIPGNPSAQWQAGLGLEQPVYSHANMIQKPKTLKFLEDLREHEIDFVTESVRLEASLIFVEILRLEFQKEGLLELKQNLKKRQFEMKRLNILGVVTELDQSKIAVAINDCLHGIETIDHILPNLQNRLSALLGTNFRVLPQLDSGLDTLLSWVDTEEYASKKTERADIMLDQKQIQIIDSEIEEIRATRLPEVSLKAQSILLSPSPFKQETWNELSIGITMDIWTGGTKGYRIKEKMREKSKKILDRQAKIEAIEAEAGEYFARFVMHRKKIATEKASMNQLSSSVELSRKRFNRGKARFLDVIDGEFLLRDKRDAWRMAHLDAVKNLFQFRFLLGQSLLPLAKPGG
ncbi:MAG: efflux RND transporter permease subunit [Pseudobacteriovorax sp.]|nr:efflux RND transporter permease subunit [Pseudobacteriovorax sp.]